MLLDEEPSNYEVEMDFFVKYKFLLYFQKKRLFSIENSLLYVK